MTTQPPLTFAPTGPGTLIGAATELVQDEHGGQVFIHGLLTHVWDAEDQETRRFAAVNLLTLRAASAGVIATAFGVSTGTLWRWKASVTTSGIAGLISDKPGPQSNSKLTPELITQIHELKASGLSNRAAAEQAGVSEFSVRRAMRLDPATGHRPQEHPTVTPVTDALGREPQPMVQEELPLLAAPESRTHERVAASIGALTEAAPVFTAAARVPYAGLLLALPVLEATGLRGCVHQVYGCLKPGFYGLDTMVLDTVFRTLAGEPRAEGATRLDPVAFGRILGMDRAPEVQTVRRKHQELAAEGKATDLVEALARHHLHRLDAAGDGLELFYVDGHARTYQGTKYTGKQYSTRLKFPTPASMETWVSDPTGAPVFMVMAEPNSSLVGELRRLVPMMRELVGDERRVLVCFDRDGWSPALFHDLSLAGFDPLSWRKGETKDVDTTLFAEATHTDRHGVQYTYQQLADTMVELTYGKGENQRSFPIRQISRIVAAGKQAREATGEKTRQIHLLTTNTTLPAAELMYHAASRWRQENYFRCAREHFALDSHDSYQASLDDVERSVPNPAKEKAKRKRDLLAVQLNALAGAVEAQELRLTTPQPGENLVFTNQMHNDLWAPVTKAKKELDQAEAAYKKIPTRLPLGEVNPGQLVLDTELKQLMHAFRMAAYNVSMMLATEVRVHTSLKAHNYTHQFVRQALTGSGDIDPRQDGYLDVVLDPMPTKRQSAALAEFCERLTATGTVYPGTDRVLRYRVKGREVAH
ncbi:putative transposase [Glutamicibacter uratoxydans]|uniref:putative transposase n=1 Tax=Glutamicibacter uratoxydans TaxID=43667 RepID=UPI003D6F08FC